MRINSNVARLGIGYLIAASFCSSPSWALTNQDVVYAIKKAGILGANVGITARVDNDKVGIATYRNVKNNDKDTKIDAAMIAKTVADLGGDDIVRVTIYFYGSDMTSYDEVSLTKGDIKAFGSGQMSKDEFLSSMVVNHGKQETGADRVTRRLEGTTIGTKQYKVTISTPEAVDITVDQNSWVPDDEVKLEALQIAMSSASALPTEATKVKVSFLDPEGKSEIREVVFNKADLSSIWKGVQSSLESAIFAKKSAPVEVGNLTVALGPHREERERLLVQLKELDKLGVGIVPFIRAFQSIEANLNTLNDAALVDAIQKLSMSLSDQEKAFKAAKAAKPTKTISKGPVAPAKVGRWAATGQEPVIPGEVLANPDQLVNRFEAKLGGHDPKFVNVLDQVSDILRKNNRAGEAAKFEQRAAQLRATIR